MQKSHIALCCVVFSLWCPFCCCFGKCLSGTGGERDWKLCLCSCFSGNERGGVLYPSFLW